MTTTTAMPELPEPDRTMWQHGKQIDHYTADQMRARDAMWAERLATLQSQPAAAEVSDAEIKRVWYACGVGTDYDVPPSEDDMRFARAILALRPQAVPMTEEPQWIVNDLGELGVKVGPRFFFLYKGGNIEYGADGIGDSRDGVALHGDGTPMHYRIVGKREFGETCLPLQWVVRGHSESRYTEPLTFIPGLSWGKPEDGEWKPLPSRGIAAPAGGEG